MPTLHDYASLAPFGKVDELVDAANSILRQRPRLRVSARTVRYYAGPEVGILPKPSGSPKFPRYGMEHLIRLVAARCMLDSGETLLSARAEIDRMFLGGLEQALDRTQALVAQEPFEAPLAATMVMEARAPFRMDIDGRSSGSWTRTWRLRLAQGITLEVADHRDRHEALLEAKRAIEEII